MEGYGTDEERWHCGEGEGTVLSSGWQRRKPRKSDDAEGGVGAGALSENLM